MEGKIIYVINKYSDSIKTSYNFYKFGEIPIKAYENAVKAFIFNQYIRPLGFYDTTITNNGKLGYVFTIDAVFYKPYRGNEAYIRKVT